MGGGWGGLMGGWFAHTLSLYLSLSLSLSLSLFLSLSLSVTLLSRFLSLSLSLYLPLLAHGEPTSFKFVSQANEEDTNQHNVSRVPIQQATQPPNPQGDPDGLPMDCCNYQ